MFINVDIMVYINHMEIMVNSNGKLMVDVHIFFG